MGSALAPALGGGLGGAVASGAITGGTIGATFEGGNVLLRGGSLSDAGQAAIRGGIYGAATGAVIAGAGYGIGQLGNKPIPHSKTHPVTGVKYDEYGNPDFSPHVKKEVMIPITPNRNSDRRAANIAAGYKNTPKGDVWHHAEIVKGQYKMQLLPEFIHSKTGHRGAYSESHRVPSTVL